MKLIELNSIKFNIFHSKIFGNPYFFKVQIHGAKFKIWIQFKNICKSNDFFMLKIQSILGSFWDLKLIILISPWTSVAMFLLACLVACCAVGFMAPKRTAAKATVKPKAKKKADDAKKKALLQANLASQAKNAKVKLQEASSGKVEVSEEEKTQLQCKVDFFEAYKKLKRLRRKEWNIRAYKDGLTARKWLKALKLKRLLLNLNIWVVTGLVLSSFSHIQKMSQRMWRICEVAPRWTQQVW